MSRTNLTSKKSKKNRVNKKSKNSKVAKVREDIGTIEGKIVKRAKQRKKLGVNKLSEKPRTNEQIVRDIEKDRVKLSNFEGYDKKSDSFQALIRDFYKKNNEYEVPLYEAIRGMNLGKVSEQEATQIFANIISSAEKKQYAEKLPFEEKVDYLLKSLENLPKDRRGRALTRIMTSKGKVVDYPVNVKNKIQETKYSMEKIKEWKNFIEKNPNHPEVLELRRYINDAENLIGYYVFPTKQGAQFETTTDFVRNFGNLEKLFEKTKKGKLNEDELEKLREKIKMFENSNKSMPKRKKADVLKNTEKLFEKKLKNNVSVSYGALQEVGLKREEIAELARKVLMKKYETEELTADNLPLLNQSIKQAVYDAVSKGQDIDLIEINVKAQKILADKMEEKEKAFLDAEEVDEQIPKGIKGALTVKSKQEKRRGNNQRLMADIANLGKFDQRVRKQATQLIKDYFKGRVSEEEAKEAFRQLSDSVGYNPTAAPGVQPASGGSTSSSTSSSPPILQAISGGPTQAAAISKSKKKKVAKKGTKIAIGGSGNMDYLKIAAILFVLFVIFALIASIF